MWSYTFHMPTRFKVFLLESTMGCTGGRNIQPEQLTGLTFLSFCTSLQVLMGVFRHNLVLTVMIHRITSKKPDDLVVLQAISVVVQHKFPLPADSAAQMGSPVE